MASKLAPLTKPYLPDSEAVKLLREWVRWWDENPDAPAKMPDGLHVRSTVFLIIKEHELKGCSHVGSD